jgi:hypothetical protein
MKALLAFVLIVAVGSMWEAGRRRPFSVVPLLVLCTLVAALYFNVTRLV